MGRLKAFQTLTGQGSFDRVYKRPDKVWHTPWFVLFYQRCPERSVAFVAGKKVGNAIRRNRAKRRLRALFIQTLPQVDPGIYILVAKAPVLEADFSELQTDWSKALQRLAPSRRRRP